MGKAVRLWTMLGKLGPAELLVMFGVAALLFTPGALESIERRGRKTVIVFLAVLATTFVLLRVAEGPH